MFEGLADLASAWRTIVHVSEWSGLSIGALAAGVGLVYLRPALLKPVLLGAAGVGLLYLGLIRGDRTGRADVNAQWADARKAAIEAEHDRDQLIELDLDHKYQPQLIALQRQADERKQQSDAYERKFAKPAKGKPAGACLLGDRALRVRRH